MSLFSNDIRVANTAAPSFQSRANVSQFGWTGADQGHYNQLLQYVDECRQIWQDMEEKIAYVEQLLLTVANIDEQVKYVTVVAGEVQKWRTETLAARDQTINAKNEVLPLIADFDIKYTDFTEKYVEVTQMHSETNDAATAAAISEAAAAVSAKEAADIAEELRKGQVYRGTWNIEKNAGYPPKPDTNSVWDVTLNEGSIEYKFDNTTWYWGDRLLFLKDDDKYSQIEAGGSVTSVNGKKGAVTINASDVGAVAKSGDKMTGALKFVDDNKFVSPSGDNLHLSAKSGTVVLESKNNPIATIGGTNSTLYHTGNKPTPSEIGAVTSAGFTMEGPLKVGNAPASIQNLMGTNVIRSGGAGSHATVIGNTSARTYIDSPDETLILRAAGVERKVYTQGFKPTTTELGAVNKSGDTMSGQLRWGDSNKYVNGADDNMFVAAKAGAVYLEGKTNPMVRMGGVDSTIYHTGNKPSPDDLGAVPSAGGTMMGPLKWQDSKKYVTGAGNDLYAVAKSGKIILEGAAGPVARVGTTDYTIYHQGYKPTAADVGAVAKDGNSRIEGSLTISQDLSVVGRSTFKKGPGGIWISTVSGETGKDQVVTGSLSGGATIGGHNDQLDNWTPLYLNTYAAAKDNYPSAPVVMGFPTSQVSITNDGGIVVPVQYPLVSKGNRVSTPGWWLSGRVLRFMDGRELMRAATNGLRQEPDWAYMSKFKYTVRLSVTARNTNIWVHKYGFEVYHYQTTNSTDVFEVSHQFDCHAGAYNRGIIQKQMVSATENGGMPYFELHFPEGLDVAGDPTLELQLEIVAQNIFG